MTATEIVVNLKRLAYLINEEPHELYFRENRDKVLDQLQAVKEFILKIDGLVCPSCLHNIYRDEDYSGCCDECGEEHLCNGCVTHHDEKGMLCPDCTAEAEEEDQDEWFDRKHPEASCHRCETKLNGSTVVFCGGGGGACETWFCASCHEEGTEDCPVCKEE